MMAGPDPRRAFVMAGEAHHETHRYFDSARRRIRFWCRCLRKRRGISCPLAYRTVSARNAAGHSVGSNDTCGPDFATYDRSRTLVASGGRAATPENEQSFQRCSDQPHEFRACLVGAPGSWLQPGAVNGARILTPWRHLKTDPLHGRLFFTRRLPGPRGRGRGLCL